MLMTQGDWDLPDYLTKQLITYIGNKRKMLAPIYEAVQHVKKRTGKIKLRTFDAFSGSGVVSRFFKADSNFVAVNDMEDYANAISRCYMRNRCDHKTDTLELIAEHVNGIVESQCTVGFLTLPGVIETLYAPKDNNNIKKGERVFYTWENARRIDRYRSALESLVVKYHDLLMGPLLWQASVHTNTNGVFKAFHKNRHTGIGQFGGTSEHALDRIMKQIVLVPPVLSIYNVPYKIYQGDTNDVCREVEDIDLTYLDPPYNSHPYGSNYFMLNLITNDQLPKNVSSLSGIPTDWKRSGYNKRDESLSLLLDVIENTDSKFFLVSYNDEGFISMEDMLLSLQRMGEVTVFEQEHDRYKGSRDNKGKNQVTEYMYLLERR